MFGRETDKVFVELVESKINWVFAVLFGYLLNLYWVKTFFLLKNVCNISNFNWVFTNFFAY